MSSDPGRVPRGVPTGGEFASRRRTESPVTLDAQQQPWPALGYETVNWVSRYPDEMLTRRAATRNRSGPYQAAVPARIAARPVILDPAVTALVVDASAEIARFDAELGQEIAPFSAVLLRSESAASSQIENLTASARAIADAALTGQGGGNARMIVSNTEAMQAAIDLAENLDLDAILQMHRALMAQADAATAGRWREEPVWIGGETFSPHEADFVPPRADLVPGCMADLVDFTARDDIVALAQAAVAHAQFETIHPFTDGNGRTGRALIHAMLRAKGVARNVSVPISAGLLTDTGGYFDALTSYREGDLGPIVSKMATAALDGIDNGRMLVHDLREVRRTWQDRIGARRDSVAWKIAGALPRQPVVDAAWVQSTFGATNANALLALKGLENDGLLVSYQMTKRTRAWRSQEILACLDRFAARAGRRGGL